MKGESFFLKIVSDLHKYTTACMLIHTQTHTLIENKKKPKIMLLDFDHMELTVFSEIS